MEASVGAINRYPVKSMLGERLEQAVVGAGGLLGDRGYAVVDVADGKVGSAKNPGKWRGLLAFRAEYLADPEPDQPPPPALISLPNGGQIRTDAPDIDAVLSKLLDRPVRLDVSVPTPTAPLVLDEVWPDIDGLAPEEFVESTRVGSTEVGEAISAIPMAMFAPPGSF
ncbi:MAG TPA: MOSC N-terminal beta barrel domain-containing protein, partial [Acidimicrobiales bacterium]